MNLSARRNFDCSSTLDRWSDPAPQQVGQLRMIGFDRVCITVMQKYRSFLPNSYALDSLFAEGIHQPFMQLRSCCWVPAILLQMPARKDYLLPV